MGAYICDKSSKASRINFMVLYVVTVTRCEIMTATYVPVPCVRYSEKAAQTPFVLHTA